MIDDFLIWLFGILFFVCVGVSVLFFGWIFFEICRGIVKWYRYG